MVKVFEELWLDWCSANSTRINSLHSSGFGGACTASSANVRNVPKVWAES